MRDLLNPFATLAFLSASILSGSENGEWVDLFDGESLNGWTPKNGFATYQVEDGTILGITAEGSPNSFLCTNASFGDFELQFEVKVDDALNSGVQIRSKTKENGRVYGPQVEIEAGPGQAAWIYDEGTGQGWLSPEPKSEDEDVNSHSYFDNGEWNQYRVIAKGPLIRTFLNGQAVGEINRPDIYERNPEGFIGLQVHAIGKGSGPYEVRWRNIRIRELR